MNCEKELLRKTEEVEKLKIEVKDLKQLNVLSDKLGDIKETANKQTSNAKESDQSDKEINRFDSAWRWGINKRYSKNSANNCDELSNKTNRKVFEVEYNCTECDFQGTSELVLNKHINLKHRISTAKTEIKCRNCGDEFEDKRNFMHHRKSKHSNAVAMCKNYAEGKCNYSSISCWWNHSQEGVSSTKDIKCYICSNIFGSKEELMMHRKVNHQSLVNNCFLFAKNRCSYQESKCWYKHELDTNVENRKESKEVTEESFESEQVFRKDSKNLKPPNQSQKKQKVE